MSGLILSAGDRAYFFDAGAPAVQQCGPHERAAFVGRRVAIPLYITRARSPTIGARYAAQGVLRSSGSLDQGHAPRLSDERQA
jgi:hypothetical protein